MARQGEQGSQQLFLVLAVAEKVAALLSHTRERLFPSGEAIYAGWVKRAADNPDLSERLEAFTGRFGRLQDRVMDKLIPRLLAQVGESVGSAIDNLNRADRLGLVDAPDDWVSMRQLRNRLVHEYMDNAEEFAAVLREAIQLTGHLIDTVSRARKFSVTRFGTKGID